MKRTKPSPPRMLRIDRKMPFGLLADGLRAWLRPESLLMIRKVDGAHCIGWYEAPLPVPYGVVALRSLWRGARPKVLTPIGYQWADASLAGTTRIPFSDIEWILEIGVRPNAEWIAKALLGALGKVTVLSALKIGKQRLLPAQHSAWAERRILKGAIASIGKTKPKKRRR